MNWGILLVTPVVGKVFFFHTKKETEDSVHPRWWILDLFIHWCNVLLIFECGILCKFLAMLHGS